MQGNLGHATAAFTLDVYGRVTDQMKQESAKRMEGYIRGILSSQGKNKGKTVLKESRKTLESLRFQGFYLAWKEGFES